MTSFPYTESEGLSFEARSALSSTIFRLSFSATERGPIALYQEQRATLELAALGYDFTGRTSERWILQVGERRELLSSAEGLRLQTEFRQRSVVYVTRSLPKRSTALSTLLGI